MAEKPLMKLISGQFTAGKNSAVETTELLESDGDTAAESLCKQPTVLVLTGVLLVSALASSASPDEVALTVREPSGVLREAWPVTSGVPIPRGRLRQARRVALRHVDGQTVPVQAEVLSRWPDGSVRWLLLDFQIDLKPLAVGQLVLSYGPDVQQSPPSGSPMVITLASPKNRVVPILRTGPLQVILSADRFRLLDHLSLDQNGDGLFSTDERITDDRDTGLVLTGPDGRPFRADLSLATWELEQHGPLRACIRFEGRHALADSDQTLFRYILRLHVFRGQPFFRLEYTFVNDDQKSLMSRFHAIELRCSTTGTAGQMFLNGVSSPPGRVEQVDDLHHLIRGEKHPGHATGWAAVSGAAGGIALGVREAWQNWPKSFSVEPDHLRIGLCPDFPRGRYDGRPIKEEVKHFYYLRDGVYTLKVGVARTHTVWGFAWGRDTATAPQLAKRLDAFFLAAEHPLLAQLAPDQVVSTGVLGSAPPADPNRYSGYDAFLDTMFTTHLKAQVSNRENGLLNFGDWYHEKKFGGGWGNLEYDTAHCFFVQYLRTGDRRYFDRARQGADHVMDVDILHAVNRHIRGLDHHGQPQPGHIWTHSVGHTGGYYRTARLEAPTWYQEGMLQNLGHLWLGGLFDSYLLTGNRRALDVARLSADRVASEGGRYSDHVREIGWPLNLLMTAYEATGDRKYLAAATRTWHVLREHLNPKRGWVVRLAYGHCNAKSESKRCHGQNSYLLALTLSALARYHRATDDPEVLMALTAGIDQMIRECWDPRTKAFWGTACTHYRDGKKAKTYSTVLLAALAFAHEIRLTRNSHHREIFRQAFHSAIEAGKRDLETGDPNFQAGYQSRSFHFAPFGLRGLEDRP